MRIKIAAYNPEWRDQFNSIKKDLEEILKDLNPTIEHFGSTAVPGLAAKPIIDIAVGIKSIDDLDQTIQPMIDHQYIYFEAFNASMPRRRLFVGLKEDKDTKNFKSTYSAKDVIPHEQLNLLRRSHIHIWEFGSREWLRHIAFREYLKEHPEVRSKYAALKQRLSQKDWKNGMEYNDGKNRFLKSEESKAIQWYKAKGPNPLI